MRRYGLLLVFALVHFLIFLWFVPTAPAGQPGCYIFFEYASRVIYGELPYRDFFFEYPPLSLLVLLPPRLFAGDLLSYLQAFVWEMLLVDLLGLVVLAAFARSLGHSVWGTLVIYTLILLALGPLVGGRYDLLPAVLVLLALYAFHRRWNNFSWAALALATMTKLYPLVLAPLFAFPLLQGREYPRLIRGVLVFLFALGLIAAPCLWLSPDGFWHSFKYHLERGLQVESTYASFLLVGHTFGSTSPRLSFNHGAWHLSSTLADALARLSPIFMGLALLVVYLLCWRKGRATTEEGEMVNYALLAVLAFMLTSKVLSPQFLIWLSPLVPLVRGRWRQACGPLFLLASFLTQYIFPSHYPDLIRGDPKLIDVLLWRNLLLFLTAGLLLERPK